MFKIQGREGKARAGVLYTHHGSVNTPAFMPVATKGSVKTVSSEELCDIGVEAIISNALLLYLKPGIEVIERAGGLHRFMGWERVIFTDNGGFQALREEFKPEITARGIKFRSPFDNSRHLITPEKIMAIQQKLGSDVALALDDCPSYGSGYSRAEESVNRTVKWAEISLSMHKKGQLLFGITQGGVFPELRKMCSKKLASLDFDGYAIGGLSIGEPREVMFEMLRISLEELPEEKPRYFMGLGSPLEILEAIEQGVDIFDSAFPTRNARHSAVYTMHGKYSITKAKNLNHFGALEKGCDCFTCKNYSRAYVSHLMRVYEPLAMRLVTIHNLRFIQRLMEKARESILKGEFHEFKSEFSRSFKKSST